MAVRTQNLKKNIEGFLDHQGLFHPIRKGEKEQGKRYSAKKAGDKDDIFEREARKHKNRVKAEQIWEKRLMDEALDNALGEESKVSLTQFVRRQGGLRFDPKSNEPYNGELENLSFKQSKVKGIAHPKGKYSLDGMREAADLAGYGDTSGDPLTTINQFLDALETDMKGKKIYPFGNIGTYKFNPGRYNKAEYLRRQAKQLDRVIRKLKNRKGSKTKIAKLENVRELVNKLARGTKPTAQTLKKNGLLTAFAELAVGTSAAVGLYDRFKEKKEVKPKHSNNFVGLKDNKGVEISPERQKAIHEKNFQNFLVAIESGDLSKEPLAKIQGKLAGHEANEVSRAIQYARLTYKLKKNPSASILKQAENLISKVKNQLKQNGIVGRVLARHKAGKLYKRQLRLEAAIDRAKKKRSEAEARAKKNPANLWKPTQYKGVWIQREGNGLFTVRQSQKGKILWTGKLGQSAQAAKDFVNSTAIAAKHELQQKEKRKVARKKNPAKYTPKQREFFQKFGGWTYDSLAAFLKLKGGSFTVLKGADTERLARTSGLFKVQKVNNEKVKISFSKPPKVNPAKVQSKAYEDFQGRKPTKQFEAESPDGAPKNLYALGKLLELRLKGKPNLNFRRETTGKTFYVCSNEANTQLWIVGGKVAAPDSSIKPGYSEPYAPISHIVYETQKNHLDDTKPTGYIHKFGEEGGQEPILAFDRNGFPIIVGGSYEITPLGIAD